MNERPTIDYASRCAAAGPRRFHWIRLLFILLTVVVCIPPWFAAFDAWQFMERWKHYKMDPVVGMYPQANEVENLQVALYVSGTCACGWMAYGLYRRLSRNKSDQN